MSKAKKYIRYRGLTRISAKFTANELNDLKEVAQRAGMSAMNYLTGVIATALADAKYPQMLERVAPLLIANNTKGIGGGAKRKPIKKVTQRKKGVKVIVQGDKALINQIEMDI